MYIIVLEGIAPRLRGAYPSMDAESMSWSELYRQKLATAERAVEIV